MTQIIAIKDEGNSSLKEDELPGRPNFLNPQLVYTEDGNETDTFLNYEYSKMMNTLPSQEELCPSIQEEDKHPQENKKKYTTKTSHEEEEETPPIILDTTKEEKEREEELQKPSQEDESQ